MKLRHLILSAFITGFSGCATVNNPEGGPEDTTPPKLVSSSPADQALNVDTRIVTLTFDEEVQPKNLTSELLITPNTNNKYKVSTDKEKLTLEFEKEFEKNTTYTFNFREGVEDITKPNKAQDLKLSFSTGSFIDSSRVAGTVVNLLTQAPEKDVVVALYEADDTLTIRKNRPYYQTLTDESGNFELENIKQGTYKIFALADKNKNAIYDTEEEKIAYLQKPILITPTTEDVKLQTVKIDTKKPLLTKRTTNTDRFTASYNEGIAAFTATALQLGNDSLSVKILADARSAEVFKTPTYTGGKTILTAVDSAGNIAVDTVVIAFEGKRAQRIRGAQLMVMNNGGSADNTYYPGQQVTIEMETPVRITSKTPVTITADSIKIAEVKYPEEITLDRTGTELSFALPKLNSKKQEFAFTLDSTALIPLEGERLTLAALPFKITTNGGTGTVSGTVTTNSASYIIQLLNEKNLPVRTVNNVKKYSFKNLEPGQYKLRVLIDENNNGQWDGPNPDLETQPEQIYIYDKPLDVRANWEIQDNELKF